MKSDIGPDRFISSVRPICGAHFAHFPPILSLRGIIFAKALHLSKLSSFGLADSTYAHGLSDCGAQCFSFKQKTRDLNPEKDAKESQIHTKLSQFGSRH